MVTRRNGGVDVVFRVPSWSERWVLEDGVTMPETSEHRLTCEPLEMILRAWIARTARDAAVYANLALRWDEEHPAVGVDPDVCLVDPTPPDAKLRSLRTWSPGTRRRRVAVEVVGRDTAEKDYLEGPAKYAASGIASCGSSTRSGAVEGRWVRRCCRCGGAWTTGRFEGCSRATRRRTPTSSARGWW
nr:Uma2 family endonuclease [Deltaproteobacteria bacterium]